MARDRIPLTEEGQRHADNARRNKKRYNASIKITRKYGDGSGENSHWHKVGSAFEQPDGRIILLLDVLPVIPSQWDGGIVLYPAEDE